MARQAFFAYIKKTWDVFSSWRNYNKRRSWA